MPSAAQLEHSRRTYSRRFLDLGPDAMTEAHVDEWKRAIIWEFFESADAEERSFYQLWCMELRGYSAEEHGVRLHFTTRCAWGSGDDFSTGVYD